MPTQPSVRLGRPADPALLERWRQRLLRFDRSDLSVVAFCAHEGISAPSFYGWRKRLRPQQAARSTQTTADLPRLVPIHLTTPTTPATPVELLLPGGVLLRLPAGCDLNFVRSLVQTLGSRPC
jgi:hypothetical protein